MSTSFLAPNLQRSSSRDKPQLSPYKPIGTGYTPIGASAPSGGGGVPPVNVGDPGFQAFHAGLVAQSGGEQSMGGSTLPGKMKFQGGPFKGMTQAKAMEHATGLWSSMKPDERGTFAPKPVASALPGLRPMPQLPGGVPQAPMAAPASEANTSLLTAGLQAQRGLKPLTVTDNMSAGPLAPGQGRQIAVSGAYGSGTSTFKPVTPAVPSPAPAPMVAQGLQPQPSGAGVAGPPVTAAPLPALKADNARQMSALPTDQQAAVNTSMDKTLAGLPSRAPQVAASGGLQPRPVSIAKPEVPPTAPALPMTSAAPAAASEPSIDDQIAATRPAVVRSASAAFNAGQAVGSKIPGMLVDTGKAEIAAAKKVSGAVSAIERAKMNVVGAVAKGAVKAARWAFVGDPEKASELRKKKAGLQPLLPQVAASPMR